MEWYEVNKDENQIFQQGILMKLKKKMIRTFQVIIVPFIF